MIFWDPIVSLKSLVMKVEAMEFDAFLEGYDMAYETQIGMD